MQKRGGKTEIMDNMSDQSEPGLGLALRLRLYDTKCAHFHVWHSCSKLHEPHNSL